MKRFFASDAESDMLIAEATKTFGLKIGDIINMAIKNQFLPITEPFRTEARFILQRHTEGALEAQEIKQSMTRGIRALGTRPVRDADRLQGFFARYHLHEDVENCTITENDALWESAVEVYNILGKQISAGGISKINGARLVDDIFAEWDTLWSEKAVYDVLAALAFRCEPTRQRKTASRMTCLPQSTRWWMRPNGRNAWNNLPTCCCRTKPTTARQASFSRKMAAK